MSNGTCVSSARFATIEVMQHLGLQKGLPSSVQACPRGRCSPTYGEKLSSKYQRSHLAGVVAHQLRELLAAIPSYVASYAKQIIRSTFIAALYQHAHREGQAHVHIVDRNAGISLSSADQHRARDSDGARWRLTPFWYSAALGDHRQGKTHASDSAPGVAIPIPIARKSSITSLINSPPLYFSASP